MVQVLVTFRLNMLIYSDHFQPRFANGTFNFTDPRHCSIHDPEQATCFLNAARRDGFYESKVAKSMISPDLFSDLFCYRFTPSRKFH